MSFELQEYKEQKQQYIQENNIMVKMIPKKVSRQIPDSYRLLWDCKLFLIDSMKNKKIDINPDNIHSLFDEFVRSKK